MASNASAVWICSACRSVNGKRTSSCYRCHAPRELVGATPETLRTVGGELEPAALHPYRSGWIRAALVGVAIVIADLATTALGLWVLPMPAVAPMAAELHAAVTDVAFVLGPWVAAVLLLMVVWAAWISRVVDNLPALGLGYSRVTPRWAVVESLIPGSNTITALARIRETLVKLDPTGAGVGLLNMAWLLAVMPWVGLALYIRFGRWVIGYGELGRELRVVIPILWLASSVGALLVIAGVARVEYLCASRHRAASSGS
jgi:hypothetical protein